MKTNGIHYFTPEWIEPTGDRVRTDVCIYGGTAAGVAAAVTASRRGKRAVLLQPGRFIGGMTSGGLSFTDIGNKAAIGGLSRSFYRRMGRHYGVEEEWKFEPHVAEQTLQAMLGEAGVDVRLCQYLDAVEADGRRLRRLRMRGGLAVEAAVFVDATYEGDLMARAGVSFTVGREGNDVYAETLNGIQPREHHQFDCPVDPYRVEGDPASGLLPWVSPVDAVPLQGQGDRRVQAYCFRMCMTRDPAIRTPFPKPDGYDPQQYLVVERWLRQTTADVFRKFDLIRGNKTDTNNHGAASTDFIGANFDWPDGDYAARERIFQSHLRYQAGLHWFMANDPSVPAAIRDTYAEWGLATDEFRATSNWPHQLYVREGRRMVADYVLTEHDCLSRRSCEDPVGMGAYNMDSHNCHRFVHDGKVMNEGDVQVRLPRPYPVSYRSIVPRRGECENLAVPVAISASHIAYGSVRMEPVFMILAESAAIAAALALDDGGRPLQDVPYARLRRELDAAGQVLGV